MLCNLSPKLAAVHWSLSCRQTVASLLACIAGLDAAFTTNSTGSSACPCGQSWSDPKVVHFCRLISAAEEPIAAENPCAAQANPRQLSAERPRLRVKEQSSMRPDGSAADNHVGREPATNGLATRSSTAPSTRKGAASENIQVFIRIRPLVDRERSCPEQLTGAGQSSIRAIDDKVGTNSHLSVQ